MKQKIQIKLAQLNLAMRHVLRNRMQKQAGLSDLFGSKKANNNEERYKEIGALLQQRDKSWLWDVLGGMGTGSLYGIGIGGIGGGALGAMTGNRLYDTAQNMAKDKDVKSKWGTIQLLARSTGNKLPKMEKLLPSIKPYFPLVGGLTGAELGVVSGAPIGAAIGGLYRGLTHNSRKQKAIDRLKELGVESNE